MIFSTGMIIFGKALIANNKYQYFIYYVLFVWNQDYVNNLNTFLTKRKYWSKRGRSRKLTGHSDCHFSIKRDMFSTTGIFNEISSDYTY